MAAGGVEGLRSNSTRDPGLVEVEEEEEYVRASEETKDIWKWSAIPRTMRDQAATMAAPQRKGNVSYARALGRSGRTEKGGTKDVEDRVHDWQWGS